MNQIAIKQKIANLKKERQSLIVDELNLQIGGIHSVTTGGTFYSDDDYDMFEIDVSSYYPNIIINSGYFVPQMGRHLFTSIYSRLLKMKNDDTFKLKNDKSLSTSEVEVLKSNIASIKICLNASYGLLGSHYSKFFAPGMLVNTTLTGQLSIIMLLEQLHKNDIQVLSSNTDGVNVRVHKSQRVYVDSLVKWWCKETGFVMDYNHYAQISYRDVNNYFYIHQSGYVKGIGIFAGDGIRKSPDNSIIRDAIFAFTKDGIGVEKTVYDCRDPFAFLTLRKVTGGAMKDGELLGGTVRWYRSTATNTAIVSVTPNKSGTHNQVAGSENGVPLMDVNPDIMPPDIDYQWYIDETYRVMAQIGIFSHDKYLNQLKLDKESRFEFLDSIGVNKAMIKKYNIEV